MELPLVLLMEEAEMKTTRSPRERGGQIQQPARMCSASSLPGQTLGHLITRPEITSYVVVGMWTFKLKKKKKPPSTKGSSPEELVGNPSLPVCPRCAGGFASSPWDTSCLTAGESRGISVPHLPAGWKG